MTDVVNPKSTSPDQLLPYHKKISAEGKALMICFISYTYMVLKTTLVHFGEVKGGISISNLWPTPFVGGCSFYVLTISQMRQKCKGRENPGFRMIGSN